MKLVLFYHSLISDWNHGNAHFLRGVITELIARDHDVRVFEPAESWSVQNLIADHGEDAIAAFQTAYPGLTSERYDAALDLDEALDGADVVIVHEWNEPSLVARIGAHRARTQRYRLLFHDTHHRSVTAPEEMSRYDLEHYDGVLAFGRVIRDLYLERGWAARAWTWHEAADTRVFMPRPTPRRDGDLVWIGNWGDGERSEELRTMLIEPVARLGLRARVHGVRYPDHASAALHAAGITYAGWLPNFLVPSVFARHAVTVHVPRRPYVEALPGIPTIRVFEALACGIPLVSCPWNDTEELFSAGRDYLVARDRQEMHDLLRIVLQDRRFASQLATRGRATILSRHTCAHRVDELLAIVAGLGAQAPSTKEQVA
ncbi:MAG: a-glycosyltransferase, Glycosyltransferase Family 4-like protein [Myxococcales bacterium]|nr:a-glycosyltransferase, Glycosyltransferase Family 4-like protein [Myxococcales bacterium]